MDKKRVACLYRVSSKQQIVDDDIPVQRNACLDFITKHKDWIFVKEYIEKGVSGYKIKAQNREILELIKEDSLHDQFDIVLVYMFDRLGRIEEETPFVLKWFVEHGIEMWSVNEGQRTLINHVDNLLNYITFWQAAGESKKTQQRTFEVKQQMKEDGVFLGCAAPFGYKHITTGEHNNKGREIKKLIIDEDESDVVKKIFNLSTINGYGARRIANKLNENKIATKRGGKWAGGTIMGILKNSIYKGYFAYNRYATTETSRGERIFKNQSECLMSDKRNDDLVIISDKQWQDTQNLINARAGKLKANIPKQTNSPLLFTGFIFCKNCGERMTLHYSYNHYKRKDGTINDKRKPFYICYGKSSGKQKCNNKNYASENLEKAVIKDLYNYLNRFEQEDLTVDLIVNQKSVLKKYDKDIKNMNDKIKTTESDLKLLKNEILNVIKGTSNFTAEILNEQIDKKSNELIELQNQLQNITTNMEDAKVEVEDYKLLKKSLPRWKETFESATEIEIKKMLLTKIIEKIEVGNNEINLVLNIKVEELWKSCVHDVQNHDGRVAHYTSNKCYTDELYIAI